MSGAPEVGEWTDEGTTVIVECVTDESNPTAEVTWIRDEANLDPLTESIQNFEVAGRYNSNIRRSVLTIQVILHVLKALSFLLYTILKIQMEC